MTTAIEARPRRWDAVVRLTHWSVVAGILANAVLVEEGSAAHIWIGYAVAALLALRLAWGLVGPREARFSAFPPSPGRALRHIGDIAAGRRAEHRSHNPLGALMVYAIWATLALVILSGVAMAGVPGIAGAPAVSAQFAAAGAADEDEAGEGSEAGREREEGPIAELHEAAVNLLYVLIVLHIAGVLFETRRSGRHIVMAMLPQRR